MVKFFIKTYSIFSPCGDSPNIFYKNIENETNCFKECPEQIKNKLNIEQAGYIKNSSFESLFLSQIKQYSNLFKDKRCGLAIATTLGDINSNKIYNTQTNISNILQKEDWIGPVNILSDACISGISAINWASNMINSNQIDSCIIIAVEKLSDFIFSGFNSLRILGKNGFYPSEGGGSILISKEYSSIEISDVSIINDAVSIASPNEDATGLIKAITKTIADSSLTTEDIKHICLHGTGTEHNNQMEKNAINSIWKNNKPNLYSIKKITGHGFSASSIWEIIYCIEKAKEHNISHALSINNAFGGNNSAILLTFHK